MTEPSRYVEMSDKTKGYAEGVVDGFEAAAAEVRRVSGGLVTLVRPPDVERWAECVRSLKRAQRTATTEDER